ncbi:tetratricopeptide repeat protein [Cognatiyoonia sp. IB215182]|uniref:tetratricopeptide repeat protein n=1 Tax=Cognatiyoonia sp. IB215182 TaxID=3097353 RepID=UPI002A13CF20|nr:tetratricopeptide repeat protein [Cognatiyoonia sp. IB215182]MDX8355153.1 tetratricopeptide repeat protein [Cognatiyoonia sp. IB215182]
MSILDLGFDSPEALLEDVKDMAPFMDAMIADLGLSENGAVQSIRDGISPHIVLGLSDDHLDAIFATGLNYMQAGEVAQAQTVFQKLVTFKSIDYRFWYALGTTFQTQERYEDAGRAYLMSLALKATDVDGYLRLGECLLAAGELENALGSFQTALALCADGHGQDDQQQIAERRVAYTHQRLDNSGAGSTSIS